MTVAGAVAAVLFGLAELAAEWTWRPLVQGALVAAALVPARTEAAPRRPVVLWLSAVTLGAIAWPARSSGLGLLALCLLSPLAIRLARPVPFVGTALATMGAGVAYLHGPVLWWDDLQLTAGLLQVLPVRAVALGRELAVVDGERIHLSAFSVLAALPAVAAVLTCRRIRGPRLLVLSVAALLIAVVCRVGLVLMWTALGHPLWPLHPVATALYVILVALLTAYIAIPSGPTPAAPGWVLWPLAMTAGLGLWLTLSPASAAPPRPLRILIDDAHGEWETTQRPYGIDRYGRDTVYTYTLLREWLSRRHQVEVETSGPLRPRGDVVVLKTPALPYTEGEQATLRSFVERGGGLLVIGDHTNLFGTTDHLNALLEPFRLSLRRDAAIPFAGVTRRFRPAWWNAGSLVPEGATWEVQTSSSVTATSWRARPLVVDLGVLGEAAEYSNERNFGGLRPSPDDRRPPLVVAATAPRGRGRVVVLADSTPWSNFSFYAPPNKEILDTALRLAATPPRNGWRGLGLVLAIVAGALAAARSPFHALAAALATYALLAVVGAPRGPLTVTRERGASQRMIVIDGHTGPIDWTSDIRTGKAYERDVFGTFLAWTSRFGAEPEILLRGAYADATRPVLVLNPSRLPGPAERAAVDAYVREGGRLLILDDPAQRPSSTAPAILEPFGIHYRFEVVEAGLHEAAGPQLPRLVWALPLTLLQDSRREPGPVLAGRARLEAALAGVEPVWVDSYGLVVYGRKSAGKGRVHVFIRSSVFSQLVMGDVWGGIEPGPEKEQIYQLEYALLRDLMAQEDRGPRKEVETWER